MPFASQKKFSLLAASVSLSLISSQGHAAGFGIIEQSITGLGSAFSSGSAGAGDGGTIYFNPAGMSFLDNKKEITLGAHIIDPNAKFKNEGSVHVTTAALTGSNESDAGPVALVPNFYYTRPLNDKWIFGFGMNAPFGLVTEYDDDWVGRYHALTSDLKTVNLNPSFSYKANDRLSIGFGVSAQYIKAKLSNAIDYGGICFIGENITIPPATSPELPAGFCAANNLESQLDDGEAEVTGDDWSLGYNFGLMWQASDKTRIGLAYRSRIKHKLEGEADFDTPSDPGTGDARAIAAGNGLVDGDVVAKVTLPDSLSIGFDHKVNNKLTVNGDLTWTNWSLLDELRVEFDTGADDNVTTLDWHDSNRYSLGLTYVQDNRWTWRAGIAYDEATQKGDENISVRVPDNDRLWLSVGFTYSPSKDMNVDFGYAHLFVDDVDINKSLADTENLTRGQLTGEYSLDVNILSAQARWAF